MLSTVYQSEGLESRYLSLPLYANGPVPKAELMQIKYLENQSTLYLVLGEIKSKQQRKSAYTEAVLFNMVAAKPQVATQT